MNGVVVVVVVVVDESSWVTCSYMAIRQNEEAQEQEQEQGQVSLQYL